MKKRLTFVEMMESPTTPKTLVSKAIDDFKVRRAIRLVVNNYLIRELEELSWEGATEVVRREAQEALKNYQRLQGEKEPQDVH
jgi:hypothetical protein